MSFLADTWVLWLILCILALVGMQMYRKQNSSLSSVFSSAEDFSVRTILFGFGKGEGDLFLGYMVAIVSFSLFVAGLAHFIYQIFF